MDTTFLKSGKNHHYEVTLRDFTIQRDYIQSVKPDKEKGQKYQSWIKNLESYDKHYAKTPYWVQVVFYNDDDLLEQIEFNNFADAESMYNELITCPDVPDFIKLGFR